MFAFMKSVIIGSANGSTAIFLAGKGNVFPLIIGVCVLIALVALFVFRHKK